MLLAAAVVAYLYLDSPLGAAILVTAIAIEIAEVYFWIWFLRRYRVQTGSEGMVGKRAVVVEAADGEGRVRVHGEVWRARFGSDRVPGEEAEITGIDGLTVEIE